MASTKQRMIDAARDLLLRKGVETTTVDDVLKATDTGKSQFYHYFGSKDGMVNEVLATMLRETSLPVLASWDVVQPWLQTLASMGRNGHPFALLVLSMAPEARNGHPLLHDYLTLLRQPLRNFLLAEQRAGRLLASADCHELADLALTGMIGSTICMLAPGEPNMTARTAHHLTLYLKAYARA